MAHGLTARSVVASTLLGTHPPRLAGRRLVAFAEEFGINPGTTRVALTRMVDRGELIRDDDGVYALAGNLLERQARQEAGLEPALREWSGEWELVIVRPRSRASTDRAALRRACAHLGLAEHREGVWMRPANLDPGRLPPSRSIVDAQADVFGAHPTGDPRALVVELFATAGWAAEARRLADVVDRMRERLERSEPISLSAGFELAAAALRHLMADPLLPDALWPPGWPSRELRTAYRGYDRAYRAELSAFFREH